MAGGRAAGHAHPSAAGLRRSSAAMWPLGRVPQTPRCKEDREAEQPGSAARSGDVRTNVRALILPHKCAFVSDNFMTECTKCSVRSTEALRLERRLADLINLAYGLTPEEIELLWRTAPPRMPIGQQL